MLWGKNIIALAVTLTLLFLPNALPVALAWPDLPPTRAFISGPGLEGELEVRDPKVLSALRLGGLEDFNKGALPTQNPNSSQYTITRYFENGTFRMGDLNYYPGEDGNPGVVYFQDGPMKSGDRSPYDNHWFSTIAQTDQILKEFIEKATNAKQEPAWLVRDDGAQGETIAFDTSGAAARFVLPKGLRSADGKSYWAAFTSNDATALHSFDITNGAIRASVGLEGGWELGAVSRTGKWLALKREATGAEQGAWNKSGAWKTMLAVVDGTTLKTTHTLTLDGKFDIDAINAGGNSLYLIQHLPAVEPDHYQVRLYDVGKGELLEGALVDKRAPDEEMEGYPTEALTDGIWLYTLYVGMRAGHAFIHALNLELGYTWCLDLPSGNGNEAALEHYTLALAPDGRTIYAANPVLGIIARHNVEQLDDAKVVKFMPAESITTPVDATRRSGAVTPDGRMVFFGDGGGLWQFDTVTNKVMQLKQTTIPVLGILLKAGGNELAIAYADHSVEKMSVPVTSKNAEGVNTVNTLKGECPVTKSPGLAFVPPAPYPKQPSGGSFWYGTSQLWTALPGNGAWSQLPFEGHGYSQKLPWWSAGYLGSSEPEPALIVRGKQLDGSGTFVVTDATNAYSIDFGGWAIMTGMEVPEPGCWEITGDYKGQTLSFVVRVEP